MTISVSEIHSESSDVVHCVYSFSEGHPILREHFPGEPLVPAFLQLEHVRKLVSALFEVRLERVRMKGVKFLAPLKPDCSVDVRLERKSSTTAAFKLVHGEQTISQGEISVG